MKTIVARVTHFGADEARLADRVFAGPQMSASTEILLPSVTLATAMMMGIVSASRVLSAIGALATGILLFVGRPRRR